MPSTCWREALPLPRGTSASQFASCDIIQFWEEMMQPTSVCFCLGGRQSLSAFDVERHTALPSLGSSCQEGLFPPDRKKKGRDVLCSTMGCG